MPGTNSSGRPGGNPNITDHSFQIEDESRDEPFDQHIQLRVTASMKAELKEMGRDWIPFVREAIAEKLAASKGDR